MVGLQNSHIDATGRQEVSVLLNDIRLPDGQPDSDITTASRSVQDVCTRDAVSEE
jgi:hypothetical protein